MSKIITQQQKQRLIELRTEYEKLMSIGEEYYQEAKEITKEPEIANFTWDYIANDFMSIDALLINLGIKVV